MRRLALLGVLALASCAPVLRTVQGTPVSVEVKAGAVVFHNPGTETAQDVSVALLGPSEVRGGDCEQVSRGWSCSLGDVAGGHDFTLSTVGPVNNWSATYYTESSGNRPVYLQK